VDNLSNYKTHVLYKGHVFCKSVLTALLSGYLGGLYEGIDTYEFRGVAIAPIAVFTKQYR